MEAVKIKQATKAGFAIGRVGGVADLSVPASKTRRGRVQGNGEICPTLMAGNQDIFKLEADEVKQYRIRKLTPREAANLQGFPKEFKLPDSNTKAYQQFGNSVAVPVVEKVSEQIVKQILVV